MKASDTLILWNTKEQAKRPGIPFEIKLTAHPGSRDDMHFNMSSGAAYSCIEEAEPKDQAIMLMALALELIVHYGFDPKYVDETFKQIDEYRVYAFMTPGQLTGCGFSTVDQFAEEAGLI